MTLKKKWASVSLRGCVATAAIPCLLFLAACGGDSSSGADDKNLSESNIMEDTFDDLPVCSDKREGATAYVKDEKTAYVCTDGDWVVDGVSSSSEKAATTSSSSRHCEDCKDETISSSSKDMPKTEESSSSGSVGTDESSSSFSVELDCSAILEGVYGWSWDVPKECRFNRYISYGSMTDSRDKKVYKTIKIGDQTWMAENLNYADSTKTPSLLERSWCYRNVAANCDVAGRLYTWAAAIDSVKLAADVDNPQDCGNEKTCTLPAKVQGICPEGWHLPTYAEWEILFTEVGESSVAVGKILKSQTGWCSNDIDNGNGTDGVGFSALPVGSRSSSGIGYEVDGNSANFWSTAENDDGSAAYIMFLDYGSVHVRLDYRSKLYGFSVRCLQD